MKKRLAAALCSTLVVATALPALALTNEVTGFFRVRGIMADLQKGKDNSPDTLVDQRFRAKWTIGVNEYVKVVYFGEVDFQWGDQSYTTARNEGGGLGGDTVNLETKNLYAEVKVPNTPLTATIGLQGYMDNWDQTLFLADMAGVKLAGKFGNIDANLGWFKFMEESNAGAVVGGGTTGSMNNEDDVNFYAAQFGMKPNDALKFGADMYYVQNQGAQANNTGAFWDTRGTDLGDWDLYYLGVNGSYKLPALTLSGWAYYSFGTIENGAGDDEDLDISGYAASVRADLASGPLNAGARLMYFSADDDIEDSDWTAIAQPFTNIAAELLPFAKDGLMIMLPDAMQATYPTLAGNSPGMAMGDAAYNGYGLFGVTANASFVPPSMKKLYIKGSAGYFIALDDQDDNRQGTNIGGEIAAHVGYLLADNFDLSLNGAYAFLGDFYDGTVNDAGKYLGDTSDEDADSPDNPFMVVLMANVNF